MCGPLGVVSSNLVWDHVSSRSRRGQGAWGTGYGMIVFVELRGTQPSSCYISFGAI